MVISFLKQNPIVFLFVCFFATLAGTFLVKFSGVAIRTRTFSSFCSVSFNASLVNKSDSSLKEVEAECQMFSALQMGWETQRGEYFTSLYSVSCRKKLLAREITRFPEENLSVRSFYFNLT